MTIHKKGQAHWEGDIKHGKGYISSESGALKDQPYGFNTRFEGKPGTNPEELLGAAHSACFSMALSLMRTLTAKAADKVESFFDGDGGRSRRVETKLPPSSSPTVSSPLSPPPDGNRDEVAALLRKLKRRGDTLDRKCASMRQALSLALNCLEDTSSVVEAVTGKPLSAFTVPCEVPKSTPNPPESGKSSGDMPFFAGAEFMVEEIRGLLRKGKAAATAAGLKIPSPSSGGGGVAGTAGAAVH